MWWLHRAKLQLIENGVFSKAELLDIRQLSSLEPLIEGLEDEDFDTRTLAVRDLGIIGNNQTVSLMVDVLLRALKDVDGSVRAKATNALAAIGDVRAVEPIVSLLRDAEVGVRVRAAWALNRFEDTRIAGPLLETLEKSELWCDSIAPLRSLLVSSAKDIESSILKRIAKLPDEVSMHSYEDHDGVDYSVKESLSCSSAKLLARAELIRRGLIKPLDYISDETARDNAIDTNIDGSSYKVYSGHLAEIMPVMKTEGRIPLSVAEVMRRRLEAYDSSSVEERFYINGAFGTGDIAIMFGSGDLKLVLDSQHLKNMTLECKFDRGAVAITKYGMLDGERVKGPFPNSITPLTKEDVKSSPFWRYMARDQHVLSAYVDLVFAETKYRTSRMNTIFGHSLSNSTAGMTMWVLGGLDSGSDLYIDCHMDRSNKRIIGCLK